ncbi:hypothetical protein C4J81_10860 [Deltaproteobacteria bacterium Smac51]|nr:hypothetical protein C4J81_10860 [Deltaproteobacteria bacterium Smac51]
MRSSETQVQGKKFTFRIAEYPAIFKVDGIFKIAGRPSGETERQRLVLKFRSTLAEQKPRFLRSSETQVQGKKFAFRIAEYPTIFKVDGIFKIAGRTSGETERQRLVLKFRSTLAEQKPRFLRSSETQVQGKKFTFRIAK